MTVLGGSVIDDEELVRLSPHLWLADEVTGPWRMECRCGAAGCRGVVTGDDRRRPDLQERYAGRFSPFVDARLAGTAT